MCRSGRSEPGSASSWKRPCSAGGWARWQPSTHPALPSQGRLCQRPGVPFPQTPGPWTLLHPQWTLLSHGSSVCSALSVLRKHQGARVCSAPGRVRAEGMAQASLVLGVVVHVVHVGRGDNTAQRRSSRGVTWLADRSRSEPLWSGASGKGHSFAVNRDRQAVT